MPHLTLSTTLSRPDIHDATPTPCDVIVYASIASHVPGYPATRDEPGCDDEFEFAMEGAELDGEHDDCPGPFTDGEKRTLLAWLMSDEGYRAACAAAAERGDGELDWDDARDRARDDEMTFGRWAA